MTLPTSRKRSAGELLRQARDWSAEELRGWVRWAQRTFTRENFLAAIKTFSWLAPLTLLIWVYAEREQIYTTPAPGLTIPFDIRTNDPNRYVTLQRMPERSIMAQISGPRARVDEISQKIQPRGENPAVVLTIDSALSPGRVHEVDTAQLLANSPMFAASGVTITNCKPAKLPVVVDVFEERELEVQVPAGVTNLVAPPIFEPRRIRIRAPHERIVRAEEQGPLVAYADLAGAGMLDKPGAREGQVRVYCPRLERDEAVTFTPTTVKATLEVRQSDVRGHIRSMTVFITGPRTLLNQYDVEAADVVTNVTVIGPPDKIELLEKDEYEPRPKAVLEISRADLPAGTSRSGRLKYDLPEGVKVSSEDMARPFDYKLVEKSADQ